MTGLFEPLVKEGTEFSLSRLYAVHESSTSSSSSVLVLIRQHGSEANEKG